jgi:hypothetical protein
MQKADHSLFLNTEEWRDISIVCCIEDFIIHVQLTFIVFLGDPT